MSLLRVHRPLAFAAALALAAPLTLLADPAQACTCGEYGPDPYLENERRAGRALAVVTQTNARSAGLELRIDRSAGPTHAAYGKPLRTPAPALPAVLTRTAAASGCGYVPFQGVKAVSPYPLGKSWSAAGCRDVPVGDVLQIVGGDAPTTSTAQPVAVLAGRFGNSGLVAIDARGEAVAWDRTKSRIANLAVCPGGRTVVSWDSFSSDESLTVRDARTLAQMRGLSLPANLDGLDALAGLRCLDAAGTRAQVLVPGEKSTGASTLYTVTENTTAAVPVDARVVTALVGDDGFLGTTEPGRRSLVRIAPDGRVRVLRKDFPQLAGLALSPDRRSLAGIAQADWSGGRAGSVVAFASDSGAVLGSWLPDRRADALTWIGDRLAVRVGHVNEEAPYRPGTLELRDRRLRPAGFRPAAPGSLAAVGDLAIGYGRTRFSLTAAQGEPLVVDNLWLAPTTHVVSLLDAPSSEDFLSTDRQIPYVMGSLGLVALALAVAARRGRAT